MSKLNVGIIGYGWVATAHIAAINATARAQVTAVYSARPLDPALLASRHGPGIRAFDDLHAMLADPTIDIVSICSYPWLHAEHAQAAAKAGKHLIIEKPLALSWEDCLAVRDAVAKAGVLTCVCFECRYSAQFLSTRSVIDSGMLGEIHYGEVDYYHGIGPWYGQYRWNVTRKGGGSSLLSAGCHALERFFLRKEKRRFEVRFSPHGDWPMADGSMSTPDMHAETYVRPGEENALRRAFQRCHNFIHGNEGMPKDAAFWQFLYLIFAKMHDERTNRGKERKFFAAADEPFNDEGRMKIRARLTDLFKSTKKRYTFFRDSDEITLSDRALSYMVMELARYNFSRSDVDAKGAAYQEIVGTNLRGDRGQYFTPRCAVNLVVRILNPKENEKVFDPADGTGGFIVATLAHRLRQLRAEYKRDVSDAMQDSILDRLSDYAKRNLFGADFDPFLVRASTMNVLMAANIEGNIFHMDSLAFPRGHLPGNDLAKKHVPFASVDVLMTNPPFGSEIPITEKTILDNLQLAKRWTRDDSGGWLEQTSTQNAVAPEVLFIEQSLKWLKPGGRMGIVLPNGILGNPGDEYIRRWILRHCWVLACVEVPVEAFIVEANVGILTSLLFLKKKTDTEMDAEAQGHVKEYPIFMAVAENAGVDRRGNALYRRNPDGTEKMRTRIDEVKVKTNGHYEIRKRTLVEPELNDDFPAIGEAYDAFRQKNPEPGA